MSGVAGGKRQGLSPEEVADAGQDVGEGGDGLGIPGGLAGTEGMLPAQVVGDQDEPAEETEQDRGGAGNGGCRPLALGFDAQMGADLLEGNLHLPALQVGGEDGLGAPVGVGAEQGLGVRHPVGSRRSSQRKETVGWPGWYQRAVPVAAWRCLWVPSGQRWVRGGQTVAGWVRSACREG